VFLSPFSSAPFSRSSPPRRKYIHSSFLSRVSILFCTSVLDGILSVVKLRL